MPHIKNCFAQVVVVRFIAWIEDLQHAGVFPDISGAILWKRENAWVKSCQIVLVNAILADIEEYNRQTNKCRLLLCSKMLPSVAFC